MSSSSSSTPVSRFTGRIMVGMSDIWNDSGSCESMVANGKLWGTRCAGVDCGDFGGHKGFGSSVRLLSPKNFACNVNDVRIRTATAAFHYRVRIRFRRLPDSPPLWSPLSSNDLFLDGGGLESNGRLLFSFCPIFFCFFSITFLTARFPPSVANASYLALVSKFRFSAISQRESISGHAIAKE